MKNLSHSHSKYYNKLPGRNKINAFYANIKHTELICIIVNNAGI